MNSGLRKEKPANSFWKISFVNTCFGSFSCEQHLNSHLYQQLAHVQHHHLVEVHHEELVCGCQLCPLACKLPVKVAHVFPVPLIGIKIIFNYKTIFHSFTENPNNVCLMLMVMGSILNSVHWGGKNKTKKEKIIGSIFASYLQLAKTTTALKHRILG